VQGKKAEWVLVAQSASSAGGYWSCSEKHRDKIYESTNGINEIIGSLAVHSIVPHRAGPSMFSIGASRVAISR
jgi:hypothetical protein